MFLVTAYSKVASVFQQFLGHYSDLNIDGVFVYNDFI
jgi:hypothetical protein